MLMPINSAEGNKENLGLLDYFPETFEKLLLQYKQDQGQSTPKPIRA